MNKKVSHGIRLGLTVLILGLLVVFATKVNWHDIGRSIRDASVPLLLGAALVNILSVVVKAVRWWVFLRPIGATSLPLALRATFAGAGLNNVLVANGGEAARVVFVFLGRMSRGRAGLGGGRRGCFRVASLAAGTIVESRCKGSG